MTNYAALAGIGIMKGSKRMNPQRFVAVVALLMAFSALAEDKRVENLQKALRIPWRDGGACAVANAAASWRTLATACAEQVALSKLDLGKSKSGQQCRLLADASTASAVAIVGECVLGLMLPEILALVLVVEFAPEISAELKRLNPTITVMSRPTAKPQVVALPDEAECELVGTGGQGEICRYKCEGMDDVIEVVMTSRRCDFGERLPWGKLKRFPRRS